MSFFYMQGMFVNIFKMLISALVGKCVFNRHLVNITEYSDTLLNATISNSIHKTQSWLYTQSETTGILF